LKNGVSGRAGYQEKWPRDSREYPPVHSLITGRTGKSRFPGQDSASASSKSRRSFGREQVALAWARAARVSTDERLLATWRNAVDTGSMRSKISGRWTGRPARQFPCKPCPGASASAREHHAHRRESALTVPNSGAHPSFLSPQFPTAFPGFLDSHFLHFQIFSGSSFWITHSSFYSENGEVRTLIDVAQNCKPPHGTIQGFHGICLRRAGRNFRAMPWQGHMPGNVFPDSWRDNSSPHSPAKSNRRMHGTLSLRFWHSHGTSIKV